MYWAPYPRNIKFLNKMLLAKYNFTVYDPQKSIQILESLGFKRGTDGVWITTNGTSLEFELEIGIPTPPEWLAVIEDLNAIDINVTLKPLEWALRCSHHAKLKYDIWASWA